MKIDWTKGVRVECEGEEPELSVCARVGHAWETDGAPDVPLYRYCHRCIRCEVHPDFIRPSRAQLERIRLEALP